MFKLWCERGISFVGDQTQTSARPSCARDFESSSLMFIRQKLLKH